MNPAPAVTRGKHFAHVSPGSPDDLERYVFDMPGLPPWKGKLFYSRHAGGGGAEVSLNRLPGGAGVPFLHRHQRNDEWYLVVSGRGRFLVDGEIVPLAPGDAVRVEPAGARSLHSTGPEPLVYWCVQAPADGDAGREIADGALAEGAPPWA
ncbi:MAG: cupin domain-containing protein [Planctomycetota bacterium]